MKQMGVTLVELLVTIALSSLTFIAALQLIGTSLGSSADLAALSNINDKAGHAMLLIGKAVARAGYLGCGGRASSLTSLVRTALDETPELNLEVPYEIFHVGLNAGVALDPTELPIAQRAIDGRFGLNVNRLIAGNDMLLVRGLGFSALPLRADTQAGGEIEVRARRGLVARDFVAITDCQRLEVFRLSSVRDLAGRSLLRRAAGPGGHDNQASRLSSSRVFRVSDLSNPRLHPVETEIFFIASGAGGQGHPALWRKDTHRRPLELIEGVRDMRLQELRDADGHVLGLRLDLAVRSAQPVAGERRERRFVRHFAFENL